MEYEGDSQGGVPSPLKPPLKIRVNKQLEAVKVGHMLPCYRPEAALPNELLRLHLF